MNIKNNIHKRNNVGRSLRDVFQGFGLHSAKVTSLLCFSLLLILFVSCSLVNEDLSYPPDNTKGEDSEELYITLSLSIPNETNSTRGSTTDDGESSDGRLGGAENEVLLKKATLYFYDTRKKRILLKIDKAPFMYVRNGSNNIDKQYELIYEIELSELRKVLGQEVELVVVGNEGDFNEGYSGLSADMSENDNISEKTFSLTSLESRPIGDFGTDGKGKVMPLVNAKEFPVDFTEFNPDMSDREIIEKLQELGATPNNNNTNKPSYNNKTIFLTPEIVMERAVARIDWKDKERNNVDLPANIYNIGNTDLKVQLYSLQVFNVNKESYLFRHTAKGEDTESANQSIELFGKENDDNTNESYNWVAGSDWTLSDGSYTKNSEFINELITDPETNAITGISVTDGDLDGKIKISDLSKRSKLDGYHPWRYVTENTLPSIEIDPISNATGLAFQFQIMNGDNPLTKEDIMNGTDLPSNISKATSEEIESGNGIKITDKDNEYILVDYTGETKDSNGNTIDEGGYYITYYAFLIHNDSSAYTEQDIPPMYYGTVRNNIYQVYVKSIGGLPNPNEPDNQYLSIDIRVLAWAKRDIHVTW